MRETDIDSYYAQTHEALKKSYIIDCVLCVSNLNAF